jgi:hypothetical protein
MSCFNNLFKLKKTDVKKLIKSMDKSVAVGKLNKTELLCQYFSLLGLTKEPPKRKNMWGKRHWNMYGDRPDMRPLTNQQQLANDLALEKYGYRTKKDFVPLEEDDTFYYEDKNFTPLEEDYIYANIDEDYVPPPKYKPKKEGKKRLTDEDYSLPALEEITGYFKSDYKKDKKYYDQIYYDLGFRPRNEKQKYDKYTPKLYKILAEGNYVEKDRKPSAGNMEKTLEVYLYESLSGNEKEKFGNFLRYKYGTTGKNPLPEF